MGGGTPTIDCPIRLTASNRLAKITATDDEWKRPSRRITRGYGHNEPLKNCLNLRFRDVENGDCRELAKVRSTKCQGSPAATFCETLPPRPKAPAKLRRRREKEKTAERKPIRRSTTTRLHRAQIWEQLIATPPTPTAPADDHVKIGRARILRYSWEVTCICERGRPVRGRPCAAPCRARHGHCCDEESCEGKRQTPRTYDLRSSPLSRGVFG